MKFLQELRRRRVFRLAGLYIVGAWLVIQVADISFPAWGVPETALRYLFIAAAACFPIALIFSWYYDITARGIVRTEPAGANTAVDLSLKRGDYIILTTLLGVGLAVVFGSADKIQDEIDFAVDRRAHSIAVLPFANLDMNPDTGYFSDGITEEILHRLSTLGALHVLASTSSFAFRNSEESPARISAILGVGYLLQGSIRRDADQVRITARLLDESGFQVWSDTYDRQLESIFAIQAEIASKVSTEIVNEIVPLQEMPAGRTTRNMEAYNQYLIGKAYFDARTPGWREKAVEAFQRAVELDPAFAPPYAGHAMSIAINAGLGPNVEEAAQLAERALQLDPDLAEAHAILGLVTAFPTESSDPVKGEQLLRRAIDLDPSFAHAYNWLNFALSEQERDDEAEAVLRKGLDIDPLNPPMISNVAGFEAQRGNFERAESLLLRVMALPEPSQIAYISLWNIYRENGRYAAMLEIAKDSTRVAFNLNAFVLEWIVESYERLGLTDKADEWFEVLSAHSEEELALSNLRLIQLASRGDRVTLAAEIERNQELAAKHGMQESMGQRLQYADTLIQLGRFEESAQLFEATVEPDFETLVAQFDAGDAVWVMQRLAFVYQRIGRGEEADAILSALDAFHTENFANGADPAILENHALTDILRGDFPAAAKSLRQAVDQGWCNYLEVLNDVRWGEAIGDPEIAKVLQEGKAELDRQRALAEAADAEHDFRAEFERLLAD